MLVVTFFNDLISMEIHRSMNVGQGNYVIYGNISQLQYNVENTEKQ